MAKSVKKTLNRAAVKFRKNAPALHSLYSLAIIKMADYIKTSGAPEVTVKIRQDIICGCYASD